MARGLQGDGKDSKLFKRGDLPTKTERPRARRCSPAQLCSSPLTARKRSEPEFPGGKFLASAGLHQKQAKHPLGEPHYPSYGVMVWRQFGAVLRNSTLAQLTARSGVRQNFLGGSDKRRTAPNCRSSLGGTLMARDEQLPRLSYTTTLK